MAFTGALMRKGKFLAATAFALGLLTATASAYSPEQEAMCSGDAMRLCSEYIPNVDRITACMVQNYSQLSEGCKSMFDAPPAPSANTNTNSAARAKPSRPLNLTPNVKRG